ncbi:hypothetical protein C2I06_18470 [Niallia circulans]|uniref:hypothetical protein n=1 Tax=Niallia circulans TaxID=1397 RepID=UPI000F44D19E|nr:hypothetical protein [Niallia circulans]AYV68706.1 hypothetical protein C2I06_18470 [Niallia circulans]
MSNSINQIDPHLKLKVLQLQRHSFNNIHAAAFQKDKEKILNYVLENLNCFHEQYDIDWDDMEENYFFHWDISHDPVIPYILGYSQKEYEETKKLSGKHLITIHYRWHRVEKEQWNLCLFGSF